MLNKQNVKEIVKIKIELKKEPNAAPYFSQESLDFMNRMLSPLERKDMPLMVAYQLAMSRHYQNIIDILPSLSIAIDNAIAAAESHEWDAVSSILKWMNDEISV